MVQTSSHSCKALGRRRQEDASNLDDVSWSALPSYWSSSMDADLSGHVANRNLVRRLLNLNFLEAHKL